MPILKANDVNLYYELHGLPERPVLVLNNGILMNAAKSWAYQTAALARHYHLLQYDCRGQGQSDHPDEPYSMALHAQDLAALLDALSIPSAHIAGISYGGEVAQAFALQYPQRTRSLVLADTVSEVPPSLAAIVEGWIEPARRADADGFCLTTLPWNFSAEYLDANPAIITDARNRYKLLDYPAVVRLCECFLGVNFTARLSEIQAPVCVMYGELDQLKGKPFAEILQRQIPQAEVHAIPGAGHAACIERPEAFNTIILGFLAKQSD